MGMHRVLVDYLRAGGIPITRGCCLVTVEKVVDHTRSR